MNKKVWSIVVVLLLALASIAYSVVDTATPFSGIKVGTGGVRSTGTTTLGNTIMSNLTSTGTTTLNKVNVSSLNSTGTITAPLLVGALTGTASNASQLTNISPTSTPTGTKIPVSDSAGTLNSWITGRKNVIINGNFDVWQRGTSQTSNGYGSDDRWDNQTVGSTHVVSQQAFALGQTDVPGEPAYFCRTVVVSVAGTGNLALQRQRIESVRTLAGQRATLSFYAKADAAKNIAVEFIQNFGTAGSPSAQVNGIGVTTCALTTAWKKFTVTVSIPSISGKTLGTDSLDSLRLQFWFDAGSGFDSRTNSLGQQSGTFDIAQVQLEAGPVATTFEYRSFGEELRLCQRFFEKSYDVNTAPGTSTVNGMKGTLAPSTSQCLAYPFSVRKRAVPTVVLYSRIGTGNKITASDAITDAGTVVTLANPSETSGCYIFDSGASLTATNMYYYHFTAEAEL